jgi:hypothetical protein
MNRVAAILIPAALFAAAMWGIVQGIEPMVTQERNNRFHAMLLGCSYIGTMEKMEQVLVFDCAGQIELHKEIETDNWEQNGQSN